jgi:hypothetical protein
VDAIRASGERGRAFSACDPDRGDSAAAKRSGKLHHTLKYDGPTPVLAVAQQLTAKHPDHIELAKALAYLVKREPQLDYPAFQAAGWPIGDGAIESANKLVVEARLKRSGMHWHRAHVNPISPCATLLPLNRLSKMPIFQTQKTASPTMVPYLLKNLIDLAPTRYPQNQTPNGSGLTYRKTLTRTLTKSVFKPKKGSQPQATWLDSPCSLPRFNVEEW